MPGARPPVGGGTPAAVRDKVFRGSSCPKGFVLVLEQGTPRGSLRLACDECATFHAAVRAGCRGHCIFLVLALSLARARVCGPAFCTPMGSSLSQPAVPSGFYFKAFRDLWFASVNCVSSEAFFVFLVLRQK